MLDVPMATSNGALAIEYEQHYLASVDAKLILTSEHNWRKKLTDVVMKRVIRDLLNGLHETTTAAKNGIAETHWYHWKKIAQFEEDDPRHVPELYSFFQDVARAQAESEAELVECWRTAGVEDWKAAQSYLAARYPRKWNPNNKLELTGADGGPLEFTLVMDTSARLPSVETDELWADE